MDRLPLLPGLVLGNILDFVGSLRVQALVCSQWRASVNAQRHLILQDIFETEFESLCFYDTIGTLSLLDRSSRRFHRFRYHDGHGGLLELNDVDFFWVKLQTCLLRYVQIHRQRAWRAPTELVTGKAVYELCRSHHFRVLNVSHLRNSGRGQTLTS